MKKLNTQSAAGLSDRGKQRPREGLGQDELSKFKSLLRDHSLKEELQHLLQTEVEEASRKQPADLLTARCPSFWVEMVTIQVFFFFN